MTQASSEWTVASPPEAPAVEQLDRVFRIVSIVIISLTILLMWNIDDGASVPETQVVGVVAGVPSAQLSREWAWKRPDASFDEMYRAQR